MNHDRLFKELIGNFFIEFIDLFLPDVGVYIDRSVEFQRMDKELFTDVTIGSSHEVDFLVKAKLRASEAYFVIHVENQAKIQQEFPKRMFRYFARLSEKYDLPVYPVVIYSHRSPKRAQPSEYRVDFPDREVLKFEYAVIQLNQLSWRQFVDQPNPVATALMARMNMAVQDRPKVKLECLRLLAKLKLDPARSKLIGGFIDSYLVLTEQETKQYKRELSSLDPIERQTTMSLISSWEQKGIDVGIEQGEQRGLVKGKEELVTRLLSRRLYAGSIPTIVIDKLHQLSGDQLDDLGEALLDFDAESDLDAWFAARLRA